MRTGRRIDGELTKLIVAFRNFENAPKNNLGVKSIVIYVLFPDKF